MMKGKRKHLPTLFKMFDPNGFTGWSVTFVDWSEIKCHPRSFRALDVTFELIKAMTHGETFLSMDKRFSELELASCIFLHYLQGGDDLKKQSRPFLTQFFLPILLKLATIGLAADENPFGIVLGGILLHYLVEFF